MAEKIKFVVENSTRRRRTSPMMEVMECRRFLSGSSHLPVLAAVSPSVVGFEPSPVLSVTSDPSLTAPVVSAPGASAAPGTLLTTLTPTFTWSAVTGVAGMTGYQLNLYDYTSSQFVSFQIGASATSYTLPANAIAAGHTYVWNLRVVATESSGTVTGHESNYLYFQAPAAAALPAPIVSAPGSSTSPGPVLSTLTPKFQWQAVAGITGYQLNLFDNTSSTFQSFQIAASATSFTPSSGTLTAGNSYVWNLRVLQGTQSGPPSTYFYFQTPTGPVAPPAPTLPVPTVIGPGSSTSPGPVLSSLTPTFTWTASTGITGYQLNLGDSTSGRSFSYTIAASATSFTLPAGVLSNGDHYVWNLRSLNGSQSGSPSTYLYFQAPAAVVTPPTVLPVPVVTGPGSSISPGPLLSTPNPTFTWNAVPGVTGYQLNIHDSTINKNYSFSIGGTLTSFTAPSGTLTAGDEFVWNLRVLSGSKSGSPSTYLYFQLPAASAATASAQEIAAYTTKLAHLDSEKHALSKALAADLATSRAYAMAARSYRSISKEIKAVEAERAAIASDA